MFGSVREALPDVREALLNVRKWSGGPPGCPGVVGRTSRITGIGWQALPNVRVAFSDLREWSGDHPG